MAAAAVAGPDRVVPFGPCCNPECPLHVLIKCNCRGTPAAGKGANRTPATTVSGKVHHIFDPGCCAKTASTPPKPDPDGDRRRPVCGLVGWLENSQHEMERFPSKEQLEEARSLGRSDYWASRQQDEWYRGGGGSSDRRWRSLPADME